VLSENSIEAKQLCCRLTVEALVVALKVIVSDQFSDGVPASLTEEHELEPIGPTAAC
jgi:hypothetical protein